MELKGKSESSDKINVGLGTPNFPIITDLDLRDYGTRFRGLVSSALLTGDKEQLKFIQNEAVGRLGDLNNVMGEIRNIAKELGKKF